MNPEEQLKQQQSSLLEQAASHGPYLWSSRDIQNAMQWFAPASANKRSKEDDVGREDLNAAPGGCEFLRRLLHSPGIHSLRPKKRASKRETDHGKTRSSEATAGKKRKRDSNGYGSAAAKSDNVFSSVLKGYYQLFSSKYTTRKHDSNETPLEDQVRLDSAKVEMASSQLQSDLNTIILSRLRTNELYNAMLEETTNTKSDTVPKGLQMNTRIDEYMTHPKAAILRAYTSELYSRYKTLAEGDRKRLIEKLLCLAEDDVEVQQVVLLFLLEPLRRLYVERLQKSIYNQNDNTQANQEMSSKISLYPLLTSNVIWSDIPADQIEEECSREPMQQIIDFITDSASSKFNNTPTERKPKSPNSQICWWSLPSPLLCFVSQLYFSLACAYIRYLIKTAIVQHDNLYVIDTINRNDADEELSSCKENPFESVMLRIQQFTQTSQRLESLASYVISIMEDEYQPTRQKDNLSDKSAESMHADDAIFRQRQVWNAIKRRLDI